MKLARRSAAPRPDAGACAVAAIVTAVHAGGRHVLMVLHGDGAGWRVPGRPADPAGDSVGEAVLSVAEDACLAISPSACQLRPARPAGFSVLPTEPDDSVIPVLVPLGEVAQLPQVAAAGPALAAGWFPARDYLALHEALSKTKAGARVLLAHKGLLAPYLGGPERPGPDDHPGRVADFIRRGHELGILEFRVECRRAETFTAAVMAIPGGSKFRPDVVARELGGMFGEFMYATVGYEVGRPVIYMHLPFYDSQRSRNNAAQAAAAADLSLADTGSRLSRREIEGLVARAVRAGQRLGAEEAAGATKPLLGVCEVRFWWH